jgi:hypothetical protein
LSGREVIADPRVAVIAPSRTEWCSAANDGGADLMGKQMVIFTGHFPVRGHFYSVALLALPMPY